MFLGSNFLLFYLEITAPRIIDLRHFYDPERFYEMSRKSAELSLSIANLSSSFVSVQQQSSWETSPHYLGPLFANLSFLFLFLAMSIYWVSLAFRKQTSKTANPNNPLKEALEITLHTNSKEQLLLSNSTLASNPPQGFLTNSLSKAPQLGIYGANLSLFLLLCVRWLESGHFPLSNLYESLMFLSWSCTSIHIFLFFYLEITAERIMINNSVFLEKLLGAVLAPSALFLNAFATFSLPPEMQAAGPLVPALQSNWLMMHVTVMIISYSALMLGSLLAIAYLIFTKLIQPNLKNRQQEGSNTKLGQALKVTENLDYLSYRIIGIGFPFLTVGILSGAVWANEAWGSYWSWDPKETWALLTWLVFAIYLHTRLQKGWEGEKPAMLASFGFVVVWVCYLGVNLLGEGLHSYGFFN